MEISISLESFTALKNCMRQRGRRKEESIPSMIF
jgi:hypothetical protein